MTATATAGDCLRSSIELDFIVCCGRLTEARIRQCRKDSTGNRASVAECRDRIDVILDMYLEATASRR